MMKNPCSPDYFTLNSHISEEQLKLKTSAYYHQYLTKLSC